MMDDSNSFSEELSMDTKIMHCPKCNNEMVQGYIADWKADDRRRVSNWIEGEPIKSYWYGTKISPEKCIPVGTFRCSVCGFLESYARPEFKAN
jgi:hypothetical protein